jgi:hypothetical protein
LLTRDVACAGVHVDPTRAAEPLLALSEALGIAREGGELHGVGLVDVDDYGPAAAFQHDGGDVASE